MTATTSNDNLKTWQCPCCKTVYTERVESCACAKVENGTPYPVYVPYVAPYRPLGEWTFTFGDPYMWYSDPNGTRITVSENTIDGGISFPDELLSKYFKTGVN